MTMAVAAAVAVAVVVADVAGDNTLVRLFQLAGGELVLLQQQLQHKKSRLLCSISRQQTCSSRWGLMVLEQLGCWR